MLYFTALADVFEHFIFVPRQMWWKGIADWTCPWLNVVRETFQNFEFGKFIWRRSSEALLFTCTRLFCSSRSSTNQRIYKIHSSHCSGLNYSNAIHVCHFSPIPTLATLLTTPTLGVFIAAGFCCVNSSRSPWRTSTFMLCRACAILLNVNYLTCILSLMPKIALTLKFRDWNMCWWAIKCNTLIRWKQRSVKREVHSIVRQHL